MMLKSVFLVILLLMCSCELLPKKAPAVRCENGSLHPKNEALCFVKDLVKNRTNKKVNAVLKRYEKMNLETSSEYTVLFVGGGGKGEALKWTYLVGVDYYDLKVFRSLMVVVNTYASGEPTVKEVLSEKTVEKWVR